MNNPVSFEIAKLLKEKGFEERAKSYNQDGKLVTVSIVIRRLNPEKIYYPAPTIAEVVMWLYEKHDIWIRVDCNSKESWHSIIVNVEDGHYKVHPSYVSQKFIATNNRLCGSPTEAYEAAIEYTLNNLI